MNGLKNVIPIQCALGQRNGTMTMSFGSSSSMVIDFSDKIEVPVYKLDEYVKENNIVDIKLIKVDIDGGEPRCFISAEETICKYKAIILLSIYHNAHDFFELKTLIESWELG